jgi:hypothetical protein
MRIDRQSDFRRKWNPVNLGGCVLHLPFYEYGKEATKIWDQSGNHNDGTITGAVPATYPLLSGVELVSNGGMESGNPPTGWAKIGQGQTETLAQTTEQVHTGTYSLKVTFDASGNYAGIAGSFSGAYIVGHTYKISAWVRGNNLAASNFKMDDLGLHDGLYNVIQTYSNGSWVYLEVTGIANATDAIPRVYVYPTDVANANKIFYIDDVSVQEVKGYEGIGWNFDGTTSQINCGSASNLVMSNQMTILSWVRQMFYTTGAGIVNKGPLGTNFGDYDFNINAHQFQLLLNNNAGGVQSTQIAPYNQWMCLVGTFNQPTITIYFNGVQNNVGTYNSPIGNAGGNLYIGKYFFTVGGNWLGQIGEVLIFNRALSASEILGYYQRTRGWPYGV